MSKHVGSWSQIAAKCTNIKSTAWPQNPRSSRLFQILAIGSTVISFTFLPTTVNTDRNFFIFSHRKNGARNQSSVTGFVYYIRESAVLLQGKSTIACIYYTVLSKGPQNWSFHTYLYTAEKLFLNPRTFDFTVSFKVISYTDIVQEFTKFSMM